MNSVSKARQEELKEAVNDAPLYILVHLLTQQLFGWPMYLIRNASGQKHFPKGTNRECLSPFKNEMVIWLTDVDALRIDFQPSSFIFKPEHYHQIVWSDIGLVITAGVLTYWGIQRGFMEVLYMYILPYLWVNQ